MTDQNTTQANASTPVIEGRRAMRDPWDTVATPTLGPHIDGVAVDARPMLDDALTYADDRLDRVEHMLGSLNGTLMRAGVVLAPVLTDGSYDEPDADPRTELDATPDDRRSTIAKRVMRLGHRADHMADAAEYIERRLEAILDALEL